MLPLFRTFTFFFYFLRVIKPNFFCSPYLSFSKTNTAQKQNNFYVITSS